MQMMSWRVGRLNLGLVYLSIVHYFLILFRHEFLGPDPRVAGYEIDGTGNIFIRWWDGFLSDQWSGTQKWKLEVVWDEEGQTWVEKTN
jgi:hypothetical protein